MPKFRIAPGTLPVPPPGTIEKAIDLCDRTVVGEPDVDKERTIVEYSGEEVSETTYYNALKKAADKRGNDLWDIRAYNGLAAQDSLAATLYEIVISMPQDTVDQLDDGGFSLFAFKAVQAKGKGSPLVWFQSQTFGLKTTVSWTESYAAFTSTQSIIPGGIIEAVNSYPCNLGQTLEVTSPKGTGTLLSKGTPAAITVHSVIEEKLTCGISQKVKGTMEALCAFPLFGGFSTTMAPIQKVLLMFATDTFDTGTVLVRSVSPSVMVDLTASNQRGIGFDLNKGGWQTGNQSWATVYPADTALAPLLIESPNPVNGATGVPRSLIGSGINALPR